MAVELSKGRRDEMLKKVKKYFREEHDEDFGDLKAGFVLDFFLLHLGPTLYNQAIEDSVSAMQQKLLDLDGELYEPEAGPSR